MHADVTIRHCTLRIARRGGWSWGRDPRALLRGALERLPDLLAGQLARLWPAGSEGEIAAPVRLRVALRWEDLLLLVAAAGPDDAAAATQGPGEAERRIDAALQEWLRRDGGALALAAATSDAPPASVNPPAPAAADARSAWADSVLAVLLGWEREDVLPQQLLSFSQETLAAWHDALLATPPRPVTAAAQESRQAVLALAAECAGLPLPLPPGSRATLVRRLAFLVAGAHRFALHPGEPLMREALRDEPALAVANGTPADRVSAALDDAAAHPSADARASIETLPAHRSPRRSDSASLPSLRAEFDVPCALPFLLLGPLAQAGYLRAVHASFEAARLLPLLPCFALALARKVLPAPARGWWRDPGAVAAATAFAGQAEPPTDAVLADWGRRMAPQLSPLDALVAGVLARGHTPGRPLLLHEAACGGEPGWLLVDDEGLFAIAWAARVEHLYARLATLGDPLLLVPDTERAAALLEALDGAGFRFVTDAQPARGQAWRALHGSGGLQAWSNEERSAREALLAAAQRLAGAAPSAALWQELVLRRTALGPGGESAVERSLALAAALALGSIAWTLWREREATSPLLALERFADFGARVRHRPECIEVLLPLGRRFLDLERAGLLADVAAVPWLDGRPVHFRRG